MREGFRTLADTLLQPPLEEVSSQSATAPDDEIVMRGRMEVLRETRLFHARIAEAVDTAVERVLCDISSEVLARELQIAPADVRTIVDRALQRYAAEIPVRVRVCPEDAATVELGVPVIADDQLMHGDAVVELQDGFVDARFGVRLEAVLRGCRP